MTASLILGAAILVVLADALSLVGHWTILALTLASVVVLIGAGTCSFAFTRRAFTTSEPSPPSKRLQRINPIGQILLIVTAGFLAIEFWIGAQVAPNNWDSMTYHLSRAAYWIQYGAVGDYPGASVRQLGSLPNSEILQGTTLMAFQGDTFAFAPQWLALVGIGLLTYLGGRMLTRNRSAAVMAGCLICLLPQPILQSTTTQNDLICAFFVLGGTVFALRGLLTLDRGALIVGATAFAVAIGTKGTAWFAIVGLGIAAVYLVADGRVTIRRLASLVGLTALATVIIDGYWFAINLTNGRPIDGGVAAQTSTLDGAYGAKPDLANAKAVLLRAFDFAGLPPDRRDRLMQVLDNLPSVRDGANLQISPMEDFSAFGIAGMTIIPAVIVYGILSRRVHAPGRVFAISSAVSLGMFVLLVAANPWTARLMIFIVALAAPLLALALRRWWLIIPIIVVVLIPGWDALVHNASKPLLTTAGVLPVRGTDRIGQMTQNRSELSGPLHILDATVTTDAHLGFVGGEDDWDYPLFGPHLSRTITRIPANEASRNRLLNSGLDGTFWADDSQPPPSGVGAVAIGGKYYWIPGRP